MEVRFRWGTGMEEWVKIPDPPPSEYRLPGPTSFQVLSSFASGDATAAALEVIAFDLYRDPDGRPLYVERGYAQKWLT